MKVRINESDWIIEIVDSDFMKLKSENNYTMGLTLYIEQKIYLLKEQANIIKTLKHELMHAWLYEYGHAQSDSTSYDCEDICEIVASSNGCINEIVEEFMKQLK